MRSDAQANREAIVLAAKELFQEQGPAVPFRAISARAEVGEATVHRHFPDRKDLIAAVMDHVFDGVVAAIAAHDDQWGTDPWGAWRSTVHEIVGMRIAAVSEGIIRYLDKEMKIKDFIEERKARNFARLEGFITRAADHGFVPRDLKIHQFQFGLMVVSRPLPQPAEDFLGAERPWLVDVYLDGLRARSSNGAGTPSEY